MSRLDDIKRNVVSAETLRPGASMNKNVRWLIERAEVLEERGNMWLEAHDKLTAIVAKLNGHISTLEARVREADEQLEQAMEYLHAKLPDIAAGFVRNALRALNDGEES